MDATFWALVGLIIFLGIIFYVKVPAKIVGSLDDRANKIRDELEEAKRLREEAQQLMAEYQRKRQEAEEEAENIAAFQNTYTRLATAIQYNNDHKRIGKVTLAGVTDRAMAGAQVNGTAMKIQQVPIRCGRLELAVKKPLAAHMAGWQQSR